jgi:hypothetical protein
MGRPVYSSEEGYIQFIDRLEKYCDYLEEIVERLKDFNRKELQRISVLRKRDNILRALEIGGVDNWEWYGEALDILDDDGEFKPW